MTVNALKQIFGKIRVSLINLDLNKNAMLTRDPGGPSPAFIRATIKIAHPDWTPEQIEAELQKKLTEVANPESGSECEFCSS